MGRAPCCDKSKVKKGPWSPEEDAILKKYMEQHGHVCNWIALPHRAGLNRCGKSCRLRWLNYLRPGIKHGDFTEDEDNIICILYNRIGSRWSVIASKLTGRTDNDVKNYWNTKLKKKLFRQQTDTFKPDKNLDIFHQPSPTSQQPAPLVPAIRSQDYGNDDNYSSSPLGFSEDFLYALDSEMMPISMMSLLEQPDFSSSMNEKPVNSTIEDISAASSSSTTVNNNGSAHSFSDHWVRMSDDLLLSQLSFDDPSDFLNNFGFQDKLGEGCLSNFGKSLTSIEIKPQGLHQSVTF